MATDSKKAKNEREELMERVDGARAYLDSEQAENRAGAKMFAFLSIFHPELSERECRELARDATSERKRT